MCLRIRSALAPAVLVVFLGLALPVGAFSPRGQSFRHCIRGSTISVAAAAENEDTVIYSDEWEDGVPPPPQAAKKNKNRWNALSPSVKAKIVKEAQQRAIRNKKKNESSNDKKRRKLTPSRPQRPLGGIDSCAISTLFPWDMPRTNAHLYYLFSLPQVSCST